MTIASSRPGRRYGRESQQEDLSEAQIRERFAELGWPSDRLGRDTGEDLHVRIFDDGNWTGLSFLVQLKSASDADRFQRKRHPALGYPLHVKDLLHWEVATTLVILIVWDVEKREGWWQPIPEIIKELDEKGKGWRKKQKQTSKVTVTVPLANVMYGEGMRRLRWAVADHNLPMVRRHGGIQITLSFPSTGAGETACEALERVLDFGGGIDIPGEFVAEVQDPPWMRRLYGDRSPAFQSVHVSTVASKATFPVRVEVDSSDGVATLHDVDLRVKSHGRKLVVLTNEDQGRPVRITLEVGMPDATCKASLTIEPCVAGVYEAFDVASFELALMLKGAKLQIIERATGATLWQWTVDETRTEEDISRLRNRREFLDKLCFIQRRIASQGTLSLAEGATRADVSAAERVFNALSTGTEKGTFSLKMKLAPNAPSLIGAQSNETHSAAFSFGPADGEPVRLLNIDVALGKVRFVPAETAEFAAIWARTLDEARRAGHPVPLEVQDLPVIVEYLDWLPAEARWERLSALAMRQDGYVTLSNARWIGYTEDVFHALIPAGKIERVATEVYRLVQFPPADREDLLVLWLQTDQRGVISHETALFLHGLCDILPSHLHITVPVGWTPEDRQLAADVEIRYADVPEAEQRWLGAVPYTAPLRTLRDCIQVGVSPELLEQAIVEGIQRGLFTEVDLPQIGREESA
jgi:Domain of unknown function (DUF4365)